MTAFDSWRSFWTFSREVARERRYIRTSAAENFLAAVAATCGARASDVRVGWIGWRAQLGHGWRRDEQIDDELPSPFDRARMKPLANRAQEGRVNPKGIPCLYLATELETAISEVRPWIGSLVSVAQFHTSRPLRIVDCSVHHARNPLFFDEPSEVDREQAVWAHIDRAFSEPMTRSDDTADYVATQILAELFRREGYDGVAYKSAFGEKGFNIALFDLDAAQLLNCGLYRVDSLSYRFSEADNPYFVSGSLTARL
jgi:RES domain-containing protein